ncbi:MAG: carboxypeptidase-like regulatory domain-containing protein [Bacteroidetes bacterium]|nr:carboxypeptidase-like regulatory domain-containing protein [Bacteroidota bacterium]
MGRFIVVAIVLFDLSALQSTAQIQIRGLVTDAVTGQVLNSATVQIEGTYRGSVTNENGRFLITLDRIPAVLIVRHIGYRTEFREIVDGADDQISFALHPVPVELSEVIVSGENPAVNIMRQVLQRKSVWRAQYVSSYSEVYTRFWLFRDFDPIQVNESVRSAFWKNEYGSREIVRARRIRPRGGGKFRFAGPVTVPNFYDDEVRLRGTLYATPTHPDALDIYRFRLGGRRMIDDTTVWDIYFTPRTTTRPSFTGHIAVIDSLFAILELEAHPEPPTVVTPPVQSYNVRYEQHFLALDGGIIVPLDLTARGEVVFGRLGATYPPARFEQISSISNYAIDAPVPDSMFSDDRTQRYHPLVDRSDFLFVRNPTIVPLTPRETESLSKLDPKMTIDRAFRPDGLLRQYTAIDVTENTAEDESRSANWVEYLIRNSWVWYNRVDGWHPGLKMSSTTRSGLKIGGRIGYASDREKFSYGASVGVPFSFAENSGSFFLSGLDATQPVATSSRYGLFVPGLMTYLGYDDYFDYYRMKQLRVGLQLDSHSKHNHFRVFARIEEHSSVKKNAEFNGSVFRNVQRPNPKISDGKLTSLSAKVDLGTEKARLSIEFERAIPTLLQSDFDFAKIYGTLTLKTPTFFRNRGRPNRLRITMIGATYSGDVPVQRSTLLDGSAGFYALSGSFRTVSERPIVGRRLVGVFWEHDFTTALMESLGLWRLAQQGSGIVLFGAHGKVWETEETLLSGAEVHEIGLGLTYPFRLPFRIDVAVRLNGREFSVTIGRATL